MALSRPVFSLSSPAAALPTASAVCSCLAIGRGAAGPGHVTASGFRVDTKTAGHLRRLPPSAMFRRYAFGFPPVRQLSTMSSEKPMEEIIRSKVTAALQPTSLEIHNDSHKHAHHKAMAGSTSKETHFRLVIVSEAFRSRNSPARHRMIYALLRDEMSQINGIHALQLITRTPEEEEDQLKKKAKEAQQQQTQEKQDSRSPQDNEA